MTPRAFTLAVLAFAAVIAGYWLRLRLAGGP